MLQTTQSQTETIPLRKTETEVKMLLVKQTNYQKASRYMQL